MLPRKSQDPGAYGFQRALAAFLTDLASCSRASFDPVRSLSQGDEARARVQSSLDGDPLQFEPRRQAAIADVAASQPQKSKAVGQAERDEILVLAEEYALLRFKDLRDTNVGEDLFPKVSYVDRFVALLPQPVAQAWRQLGIDEEFHPAAKRVGSSAIDAA